MQPPALKAQHFPLPHGLLSTAPWLVWGRSRSYGGTDAAGDFRPWACLWVTCGALWGAELLLDWCGGVAAVPEDRLDALSLPFVSRYRTRNLQQ